jgi:DNA adenine methylase
MNFQPIIKWSGSKRSQSESIINYIKDKDYQTYYEPFCGGCSVLFQLLNSNKNFKEYVCSDINNDLISLWNIIKNDPNKIKSSYTTMWNELNQDDDKNRKKEYFYMVRSRFNKYHDPCDFMFIMRTTTNGMPRYNSNGEFNNSFHVTRNGIEPLRFEKVLFQWSKILNDKNVKFICCSYDDIQTELNDFVYLDPPYYNTKGMYYGRINYDNLWEWLRVQSCDYMLSFDGKITSDDFTYEVPTDLYSSHEYIYSGNSSFRRIIGTSSKEYVNESLYIS